MHFLIHRRPAASWPATRDGTPRKTTISRWLYQVPANTECASTLPSSTTSTNCNRPLTSRAQVLECQANDAVPRLRWPMCSLLPGLRQDLRPTNSPPGEATPASLFARCHAPRRRGRTGRSSPTAAPLAARPACPPNSKLRRSHQKRKSRVRYKSSWTWPTSTAATQRCRRHKRRRHQPRITRCNPGHSRSLTVPTL